MELFQLFLITIIKKIIKNKKKAFIISLIISPILFAMMHLHSVFYMIFALYGGIIMVLAYFIALERGNKPLLFVFCIHVFQNLLVYFINN